MQVWVQNTRPRRDTAGQPIDCHDGCLRFFGDRFYLYGTRYGDTDGFTPANRFVCYSSPDLEAWTFHGELLRAPMGGVCYRPYVVWNPGTRRYVLWFNWYPELWEGQFAVGMSTTPQGPFDIVNPDAEVVQPKPGDHNVFIDDDGRAYLIYTSIEGDGSGHHGMSVERLDHAYTGSTGENSGVFDTGVEAPAVI
ncbi:MAG: family 43 glycosylhydrolase, partial [Planctomycetota bacterium]